MNEMIKAISQYPNGTYVKLEWTHEGLILGGVIDTIYETDNGKLEGTSAYREYVACAFRVKQVLQNSGNSVYPVGSLLEISEETAPTIISLEDETVIWQM